MTRKFDPKNSPLVWFSASRGAEALLNEVVEELPAETQLAFPMLGVERKLRTRRGPDLYQPGLFGERES